MTAKAVDWDRLLRLQALRRELGLGQAELAALLGVSPRTVQSCEQGWRRPSPALEKGVLLLRIAQRHGGRLGRQQCWRAVDCSRELRESCLVHRCRQGHLCWLLSGNNCQGGRVRSWADKKAVCGTCAFFRQLVGA